MINNWHVPRNKRKLYPIVPSLSAFSLQNLGDIWIKDINRQLGFEEILEEKGLKRKGARRDQRGGGARTYEAWVYSLGLIFEETENKKTRLTMVGESLINGAPPVPLITKQLMQFQYPSPYSLRNRVQINKRFNIRPFRFLLKLLLDDRLVQGSLTEKPFLTKAEIGCIASIEADNETDVCFEKIIQRILEFREKGYSALPEGFEENVPSTNTGVRSRQATIKALEDNANTFINYLEYTQLVVRDDPRKPLYIPDNSIDRAKEIITDDTKLKPLNLNNKYWKENFQRSYGLLPGKSRDNRQFNDSIITENVIIERMVRNDFLQIAKETPIPYITKNIVDSVSSQTGIPSEYVENILDDFHVDSFSLFETNYIDMAFSGREFASDFEHATVDVFKKLGFNSEHVGSKQRNPDVYAESKHGYSGIIDNKAYHVFSITHDYELKMINTYIPAFQTKSLSFFMYIAGGFGRNFNSQVQKISSITGINGCGIKAADMMRLLHKYQEQPIDHQKLKILFECNRMISTQDISTL
jgi:hypothetical protein